jgi:transcriptional regulator with GAF, ATPase, and Fis domain
VLLPPLRERPEDIVPLVMHFVEICCHRMRKTIEHIPPETLAAFGSYSWPGNIRELQNLVERAVILSNEGVLPNPLPAVEAESVTKLSIPPSTPSLPPPAPSEPPAATLRDSERALILQTLESLGWVIGGANGAARKLGLKRTTLIAKMKKLGISRPARHDNGSLLEQVDDTDSPTIQ